MKATFALLANIEVYNWVRKLAWESHLKYRTGTLHVRLPPHISLKQPFAIADLAQLEAYMAELAGTISPFTVKLTHLQLEIGRFQEMEFGILWLDVEETDQLRQLHDRVNAELAQRFGNTQANYDGADYHFHMTVMMGGQPVEVYRKLYDEIAEHRVDLQYSVREVAMFVYDEPMGPQGEYLTYKILPLGAGRFTMIIRPVQLSDAAEWLRMRMILWPDSTPEKEAAEIAHFLSTMPRSKLSMLHEAFVCPRPDGKLCGLVEVSIRTSAPGCKTAHVGYLEAWYVDPDRRNQGVGRALVEQAEAWAWAEGCVEMASDTDPSYPLSPAAHAALGYQEVERYFRKELSQNE